MCVPIAIPGLSQALRLAGLLILTAAGLGLAFWIL